MFNRKYAFARTDTLMTAISNHVEKEDSKLERAKFNRELGNTVEQIFTSLTGSNVKVEDKGQDFLILDLSSLKIGIRLEIKSRSKHGNYVLMTKEQVRTAVTCAELYVLCVFPDVANSTLDNFKTKARFILDIKTLLKERYNAIEAFINDNFEENETHNIQLQYENSLYKYKYKVNKRVWERPDNNVVMGFENFEKFMKSKLG